MFASLLPLSVLALPVFAQTQNITFLTNLLQDLQAANLTSLAAAAASINSTSTGQQLLAQLSNGPHTIFAPNNQGFSGVPQNISGNPQALADVLSYHLVSGSIAANATTFPNVTIGRTALNASNLVFLEGNKTQVLAWTQESDGKTHILNQNTPVTVLNSTVIGNLTVHITDAVIDVPGELTAAIAANNLTLLSAALQQAGLSRLNFVHGFTLFAPSNAAFSTALASAGNATSNATILAAILGNHVINGSTVYTADLLAGAKPTSASGESFSSNTNSSGTFITSGNSTARITTPDVVLWNGVVHIVDTLLLNTQTNAAAASSAFQSATSAAASPTTETGPVGFTPSPTASGSGSGTSQSGAASPAQRAPLAAGALGVLASFLLAF